MSDAVAFQRRGPAAWLSLIRPEKRNAIDPAVIDGIASGLAQARRDGARVVVITGTGGFFCAGADLKYVRRGLEDPSAIESLLSNASELMRKMERHPTPVVAAVNGAAIAGGLELVLACDFAIAAESAVLSDGHANFGLFPGAGATARLPRIVGPNAAKYLLYTGRSATAAQMLALGVVADVVPDDQLEDVVQELCERIGRTSARALVAMKRVIDQGLDLCLDDALAVEAKAAREHLRSPDVAEGLEAFAEHRAPQFAGLPFEDAS